MMWRWRRAPSTMADAALSWGEILYRACVMLAGLIMIVAAINALYQASINQPMIPVAPLVIAAAIWLLGLFFRCVSTA